MREPKKLKPDGLKVVQTLAARIRDLRKSHGESGTQLAGVLGITHQQQSKLERGEYSISLLQLCTIAEHYRVPLRTLVQDLSPDETPAAALHQRLQLDVARAAQGV